MDQLTQYVVKGIGGGSAHMYSIDGAFLATVQAEMIPQYRYKIVSGQPEHIDCATRWLSVRFAGYTPI